MTEREKSSNVVSGEESSESVPEVLQPQRYCQTASCRKSSSSISSSVSDKDDADESGPGKQTQQPVILQWICPSCPHSSVAHTCTGSPTRKKHNEVSHINDSSSPLKSFSFVFCRNYHCWRRRQTATTTIAQTDFMMDPLLNLTFLKPRCLCFWH